MMKSIKSIFQKRKDVHKWSEKNKQIFKKMIDSNAITQFRIDVYLPEEKGKSHQIGIEDKIDELRKALQPLPGIIKIFDGKSVSK